ncbi:iron ABC transporter substrate-binding protein [Nocardioides sp.]|uniref:iron ABC transporter substrate-binding protein n=1 Tax=Nocardioides sp. TaxID=35761 RepID=UPI003567CAD9
MHALRWLMLTATLAAFSMLGACSGDDGPKVVVYNAQHEELISVVAEAFTEETGIKVELRNGSDLELANQIVTEGDASPADVFLTENSPAMAFVGSRDLLAPLGATTLENIPARFRAADDHWTGFAARSTVLAYNTDQVSTEELPDSLMELAEPQWRDRISFSPTGADFQAIVAAVLDLEGEEATREWLEGIKANGTVYDGNNVVLESVNSGQSDAGVIYHYYWYRDQEESGVNSDNTALHYFEAGDPGAFLSLSGAALLANGDNPEQAQEFLDYLTGTEGQQVIADSYALEFPLNPAVQLDRAGVPALSELSPPEVDSADLDSETVIRLMTDVGFL